MRGCVTKKAGRKLPWYGVIERPKDAETGNRRQKWLGGFATRREAVDALTDALAEMKAGNYVEPSKTPLGVFLTEEWLPARENDLRPSTRALYGTIVRAYILHPEIGLGDIPLRDLRPKRLSRFYRELREGGGRDGRALSPKTCRHVHTTLRKALEDAVAWGLLARNPASKIGPSNPRGREMRTWAATELGTFLEHVREADPRLFPAFLVGATTGMRRGEILGLRWSDVDLEAGRLRVRQALVMVGTVPELSGTKTHGSRRSIPLPEEAVVALRAHRKAQAADQLEWGPAYQGSGLVFAREDGSPVHPERFADALARYAKAAGVPRIRVHDLRHTFATLALEAGIHPKVVSQLLGHSSVAITLDVYSHAVKGMVEDATARVAALVFPR